MGVDGPDHTVTRIERAPVNSHDTGGAPADDFYPDNIGLRQHLAAVVLYARNERVGKCPTPTDRHAETVSLQKCEKCKGTNTRTLLIRRHQVLAGDPCEVHADLIVLESLAQQIVTAHAHDAEELATLAALIEQREGRAQWNRGRKQGRGEHRHPGTCLLGDLAVGLRIALR